MDIPERSPGWTVGRLILIFTLWLTISLAMGQSLRFSRPQFPHLQNEVIRLDDI